MSPSSSSSSSTMKKIRIQQTLFQKSLINRLATIFTKAYELSVLCAIQVCIICYGPDGELKTWPQDREVVREIARRYNELSLEKRRKGNVTLSQVRAKVISNKKKSDANKKKSDSNKEKSDSNKKKSDSDKKKKERRGSQVKYPVWYPRFYYYSTEKLMELIHSLVRNGTRIQHRIDVVEARGQRRTHNTNMADEELMMANPLNHLQQHSNQNTDMAGGELMMTSPMNHLQQHSIMANQNLVMTSAMNHLQQHSIQNTNMANQNLVVTSTMNHLQQHSIQNTNMAYQNLMMNSTMNHLQQHSNQNTNVAYQNPTMNHLRQHSSQNTNMAYQNPTMNHLQQHSNQFSGFRYENGIFTPTPVSALYLNQTQSLSLIHSASTIYPNSNIGNYSRSLGVQGSGINEFQNMCTYDNYNNIINGVNDFPNQIDQFKVKSYSGLLGVEENGINEFESTNMYSCNLNTGDYLGLRGGQETGNNALQNVNMQDYNINTNGLSDQSGQFPTPPAAPGFQFGPAGFNLSQTTLF